jgi:hypothetical protein
VGLEFDAVGVDVAEQVADFAVVDESAVGDLGDAGVGEGGDVVDFAAQVQVDAVGDEGLPER